MNKPDPFRMKKKYVPHLPSHLSVCEWNYARLLRLLPDCDTSDLSYTFDVSAATKYKIRIVDSSRYTSTLELEQDCTITPHYLRPLMLVRLYHDAQVAEVVSAQQTGGLKSSYGYPNNNMHLPNEKEMVNRFLAEWLSFCSTQNVRQHNAAQQD
ncbi:DUF1249 domain-containing protein [Aestuariibacter sp. AA17]|uniref:DUF1249 domain-containing protein n=1 Tax=Fluctibacter corallii TaxID=2984329 RepID=A0ABT3A4X7_9ALTE|nr:DUF1249 domain-containing protein [Aestuariibacter sp. AA17]MCV2883599.1 DUF1249 domain-containing protein [Aestuariibacter sp. AA17]